MIFERGDVFKCWMHKVFRLGPGHSLLTLSHFQCCKLLLSQNQQFQLLLTVPMTFTLFVILRCEFWSSFFSFREYLIRREYFAEAKVFLFLVFVFILLIVLIFRYFKLYYLWLACVNHWIFFESVIYVKKYSHYVILKMLYNQIAQ